METESRTKNVAKNAVICLLCQIVAVISGIIHRTFLIKIMGVEYLGINGLFTNVLTILSFAELGIGQAITYNLYKPISERNTEKIKSLMLLYKQAYRVIAITVAVVGILLIPFLKYIVKETPQINESITLIYCLFLAGTVSSYLFTYKNTLISAHQQNYKVVLYTQIFDTFRMFFQIVYIFFTKNYIAFLIIQVVMNIICNLVLVHKTNKMFPYMKEKGVELEKEEKKDIFTNVRALVVYKFGSVVLNGTSNIIISAFVGLKEVGLLSNFTLIQNVITTMLSKITSGFTASVGNLNVTADKEKKYEIFKNILFMCVWIYGFASVGMVTLSNNVLEAWLGREYTLSLSVIIASVVHFYVNSVHFAAYTYRTTLGYFVEGKIAPLLAAILNIILSIIFVRIWGTAGVLFATAVARFFTTGIVDPVLIYRGSFKINPLMYYVRYFAYMVIVVAISMTCLWLNNFICVEGILGVLLRCIMVSIVYNVTMMIVFFRTSEFKELLKRVKMLLK